MRDQCPVPLELVVPGNTLENLARTVACKENIF